MTTAQSIILQNILFLVIKLISTMNRGKNSHGKKTQTKKHTLEKNPKIIKLLSL